MSDTESTDAVRDILAGVMTVDDVTTGGVAGETVRARGTLTMPSDEAFSQLQTQLAEHGLTPLMFREDDLDHLMAVKSEVMAPTRSPAWLAIILFVLVLVRLLQLGIQTDAGVPLESLGDYFRNWTAGLPFTLAILAVLGAREAARFAVARLHDARISPPFLIPMPGLAGIFLAIGSALGPLGLGLVFFVARRFLVPWGVMGPIVTLRAPARDRRVVFDMAVAATLAGFLVSLIILVAGLTQSEMIEIDFTQTFLLEGQSIGYRLVKLAMFGQWLPQLRPGGEDVLISTLALAGWAGLLLTIFHLLPFGSLDGGHMLYALVGQRALWGRILVGVVLVLLSLFFVGWLFWLVVIAVFLRGNAQVLDEITPLDAGRRFLGILMFVLLVLFFVPIPFQIVPPLLPPPGV